jgi:hypothetical protein
MWKTQPGSHASREARGDVVPIDGPRLLGAHAQAGNAAPRTCPRTPPLPLGFVYIISGSRPVTRTGKLASCSMGGWHGQARAGHCRPYQAANVPASGQARSGQVHYAESAKNKVQ